MNPRCSSCGQSIVPPRLCAGCGHLLTVHNHGSEAKKSKCLTEGCPCRDWSETTRKATA